MDARLTVRRGDVTIATQRLQPNVTLIIGREVGANGLTLDESGVSRRHAEVELRADGLFVTDLSTNGTFVNGEMIGENRSRLLRNGEAFQIGSYSLIFVVTIDTANSSNPADAGSSGEEETFEDIFPPSQVPVAKPDIARHASGMPTHGLSNLLRYLPPIFHDADFLGRFLLQFEAIWEPLEQRQHFIESYFDPRTCPVSHLPWLASWLDFQLNPRWPEWRKRAVLAEVMSLYHLRGTPYGLTRMIEICTGVTPQISMAHNETYVFRVRLPELGKNDLAFIRSLIETHKPAHAAYRLETLNTL